MGVLTYIKPVRIKLYLSGDDDIKKQQISFVNFIKSTDLAHSRRFAIHFSCLET